MKNKQNNEEWRKQKMKISTAEIKILIKECVKTYGMYTTTDFKNYIIKKSGKEVTRNQITGAIGQLIEMKDIVRIERGLYSKDINHTNNYTTVSNDTENILKKEIYQTLNKMEDDLINKLGSINILDLDSDNFGIITKVRMLRESIEEIKKMCR